MKSNAVMRVVQQIAVITGLVDKAGGFLLAPPIRLDTILGRPMPGDFHANLKAEAE